MAALWTDNEITTLRECFAAGMTYADAAAKIGRNKVSIRHKAIRMGMKLSQSARREQAGGWTRADIATLGEIAGKMSAAEIAQRLGRTPHAVRAKMIRLGLKGCRPGNKHLQPGEGTRGTPEQQAMIRELAALGLGSESIARRMGVTGNTVRRYAARLGIRTKPRSKNWTPEEDELLRVNAHRGILWTSDVIGRSAHSVEARARKVGVSFVREKRARLATVAPNVKAARPVKVKVAAIRSKVVRQKQTASGLDWCVCGAPVSNWEQHRERMGYAGHQRRLA